MINWPLAVPGQAFEHGRQYNLKIGIIAAAIGVSAIPLTFVGVLRQRAG